MQSITPQGAIRAARAHGGVDTSGTDQYMDASLASSGTSQSFVQSRTYHAHIRDLYIQLHVVFPITEADIKMLTTSLSTPLKDTDNIRVFVNNQKNTLASLVTAGYSLPALLAI